MKTRAIAAVLMLRGVIHLIVAAQLLAVPSRDWPAVFEFLAPYAVADGALALCAVALLFSLKDRPRDASRPLLATLADALVRISAGVIIATLPGIPYFAVTTTIFLGVLGTLAGTLGAFALAMAVADARSQRGDARFEAPSTRASLGAIGVMGAIACGFGVMALGNPALIRDQARAFGAFVAIVFGVAFITASTAQLPTDRRSIGSRRAALS